MTAHVVGAQRDRPPHNLVYIDRVFFWWSLTGKAEEVLHNLTRALRFLHNHLQIVSHLIVELRILE